MDALRAQPRKFRDLQAVLSEAGEVSSHWLVLHALWYLEKSGDAVKDGKYYRLAGGAEVATESDVEFEEAPEEPALKRKPLTKDEKVIVAACLKVGAPYAPELVAAEAVKIYEADGIQGVYFSDLTKLIELIAGLKTRRAIK